MNQFHRIRIAAHMGTHSGNIPGNTWEAFEVALRQGADIVELDVTKSADDQLFVFHPGTEQRCFGQDLHLEQMHSDEIRKLRFLNEFDEFTSLHPLLLSDALAMLKDRCVVNLDKFQNNPALIARTVRSLGMQDQVIVKTAQRPDLFDAVAEAAWDLPYMPVVRENDTCCEMLAARKDLRYFGVEAVFSSDDSMLASDEYIQKIHGLGKQVWLNSIRYDDQQPLAGTHCDDLALVDDPDAHWGWMGRKGYDIIQTDWVLPLYLYLRSKGW